VNLMLKKKDTVSILFVAAVILSACNLALASDSSIFHNADYITDGSIDLSKQAGHLCNTGAEMKQEITGEGSLGKQMEILMIEGKIVVDDSNKFETAAGATRNLAVTSAIKLCAPPKQLYNISDIRSFFFPYTLYDEAWLYMYGPEYDSHGLLRLLHKDNVFLPHTIIHEQTDTLYYGPYYTGDVVNPLLEPEGLDEEWAKNVSDQVWAASVTADPGHQGQLEMDFEAAYGPYGGFYSNAADGADDPDSWWVSTDGKGIFPVVGSDYVGNYFTIDQHLSSTDGTSKRYIDISSPWSHAYVYEDMELHGFADIREEFEMKNLPAGQDLDPDWWKVFGPTSKSGFNIIDDHYLPGKLIEAGTHLFTDSEVTLDSWLYDYLAYKDEFDLYVELKNKGWETILNRLEEEFEDFDRTQAPDPDNFTRWGPFYKGEFTWFAPDPSYWDDLF